MVGVPAAPPAREPVGDVVKVAERTVGAAPAPGFDRCTERPDGAPGAVKVTEVCWVRVIPVVLSVAE